MDEESSIDIRTDVDRQAAGPVNDDEKAQLKQIVEFYPVAPGDLISKHDRAVLLKRGFVRYKPGNPLRLSGGMERVYGLGYCTVSQTDGERIGGFVPTEEGIAAYIELGLDRKVGR